MDQSNILPKRAAQMLKDASEIKNLFERRKAVDHVTERVKREFPQFFKTEPANVKTDSGQ